MKSKVALTSLVVIALFLLSACDRTETSTQSSTVPGAQTVQVTETDYKIDSSVTTFSPGQTYHFVVTNKGLTAHEFMIMPKSEGTMNGMMSDMDKMALASISNINPGETKTLDYTFPSSAASSHPEFACYISVHYEAGMKLGVAVKS